MLLDRMLVGLGVVVITTGAALGWSGVSDMTQSEARADAPAAAELAPVHPVFGPFAAPEKPSLGTAGLWDNPWWSAPWRSSWGQGDVTALGRTADTGSDASGSVRDFGHFSDDPGDTLPGDAGRSGAGRVLAAGLEPLAKQVKAEGAGDSARFASAFVGTGDSSEDRHASDAGSDAGSDRATARTKSVHAPSPRAADDNLRASAPARVPVAAPSADKIVKQTFAYGPHGVRNEMDVYRSEATLADDGARLPTVVLVHGGSWVKGSKEHWNTIVTPFVEAGYTAVAINYRLATDAAWPAQRTDVVAAVEALKDNAALYNVDPDRMVLVGSSAGGQLAAAAATWEEAPNLVRGFVSLSGPLDMFKLVTAVGRAQENLARQVTEHLMRCAPQDCAIKYDDATPARHLDPADAPSLLVASEGDWVSPDGARDYSAASNNVGVRSDYWEIAGDKHGRDMWPAISQRVVDWVAGVVRED